jgi:hypothetical protein
MCCPWVLQTERSGHYYQLFLLLSLPLSYQITLETLHMAMFEGDFAKK